MSTTEERLKALEESFLQLRYEMGEIVDSGAAPIHTRMLQLGLAMNGVVGRVDDVPGTTTIKTVILAEVDKKLAAFKPSSTQVPAPAPTLSGDLVHIGGNASPTSAEQIYGQTMLSVSAGSTATGGDAAILFTARSPIVSHIMYATGGDKGWRFWYNMKPIGSNQLGPSDPTLGQIAHQYEKDGSVSYTYFRPFVTPAGAFDNLPGKSLTIYPGGFNTAQTGKNVLVGGGQAGRGLQFGVTDTGSNNPKPMVELNADGSQNPLAIYADGTLQRVVVKVVNGVKVFAPA